MPNCGDSVMGEPANPDARPPGDGLIVSSAYLVSPRSAEMSEFEFGLIVAGNAFHRWVVHCMRAAGLKDLMPLDVLVLHHVPIGRATSAWRTSASS